MFGLSKYFCQKKHDFIVQFPTFTSIMRASFIQTFCRDERAHVQLAVDATQQVLEKYTLLTFDSATKGQLEEVQVENDVGHKIHKFSHEEIFHFAISHFRRSLNDLKRKW